MEELQVATKSKTYGVFIGKNIRHAAHDIIAKLSTAYSAILIITDTNVAPLYLDDVKQSLEKVTKVYTYIVDGGEKAKSFDNFYNCHSYMLEHRLDRSSLIIALGGGVVGDLAGFVAATYMRGIPFIQMPTTLLAHDSSVGGKVAINHPLGKNMIGSFYQPEAVIYDIAMMDSLSTTEWRSGFAEVIKHALIWDVEFYQWLKAEIPTLADLRNEKLIYALKKGISVKAAVVAEDEKETGLRSILNFGHTLAHALEAELGYGNITHGDAVAIGMLFAIKVSETYYKKELQLAEFRQWFKTLGFPTIPQTLKAEKLLTYMKTDKKAKHGELRMVLMKAIGAVETVTVADELVLNLLQEEVRGD